jgi:hypothetical protein
MNLKKRIHVFGAIYLQNEGMCGIENEERFFSELFLYTQRQIL